MTPNTASTPTQQYTVARVSTIIFDVDGTLYEDERVYDRYAQELANFLPSSAAERLRLDWERAKKGDGAARIGMGYDRERDLLFRFAGPRITEYIDWSGRRQPLPILVGAAPSGGPPRYPLDVGRQPPAAAEYPLGVSRQPSQQPPVEVPIFGPERVSIGDWWGLADILATHYGVIREDRKAAFMATRDWMRDSPGTLWAMTAEPWLHELLAQLGAAGQRLIAMSNSPSPSVEDVLDRLGIAGYFSLIVPSGAKPLGLSQFLAAFDRPDTVLSVGDNYVNDIEPVLQVGAWAVYIDRHTTGLGSDYTSCVRVASREAAAKWLRRSLTTHPKLGASRV